MPRAPHDAREGGQDGRSAEIEISQLLLRACHDLRTAVRAIRAYAELLMGTDGSSRPADYKEQLGFIADGAKKIDRLADGLAGYSLALQIESSSFALVPMEVLLRNALARLSGGTDDGHAQVTYDRLPSVPGSTDRLLWLWENLLQRALVRGGGPVRIHVSAQKQAGGWLFSVSDNTNPEPGELENLFQPSAGRSSGWPEDLNTAICQAIVARHGGRIWAEPWASGGSVVFFVLPDE